ncbi:DUF305 domain-containing protein [Lentzea sp. NPDC102401]|uniref:DUF305 domain-containing protein n=1 Tax=Lentzea sp. NPDC102401 TaxID=3364128 RepID=UPI0038292CAB
MTSSAPRPKNTSYHSSELARSFTHITLCRSTRSTLPIVLEGWTGRATRTHRCQLLRDCSRCAEFDRRLLDVMIAHQDDAVQMARWEAGSGADREVKDLADRIDRSRTAQIGMMKKFLDRT